MRLAGKVAIITGAALGMGRAEAILFASEGATVFVGDIRDSEGLRLETARARSFGFGAKAAIHPSQVAPINSALTPSADAVSEARAILVENAKGVGVGT